MLTGGEHLHEASIQLLNLKDSEQRASKLSSLIYQEDTPIDFNFFKTVTLKHLEEKNWIFSLIQVKDSSSYQEWSDTFVSQVAQSLELQHYERAQDVICRYYEKELKGKVEEAAKKKVLGFEVKLAGLPEVVQSALTEVHHMCQYPSLVHNLLYTILATATRDISGDLHSTISSSQKQELLVSSLPINTKPSPLGLDDEAVESLANLLRGFCQQSAKHVPVQKMTLLSIGGAMAIEWCSDWDLLMVPVTRSILNTARKGHSLGIEHILLQLIDKLHHQVKTPTDIQNTLGHLFQAVKEEKKGQKPSLEADCFSSQIFESSTVFKA